jgi:hypothetical protein
MCPWDDAMKISSRTRRARQTGLPTSPNSSPIVLNPKLRKSTRQKRQQINYAGADLSEVWESPEYVPESDGKKTNKGGTPETSTGLLSPVTVVGTTRLVRQVDYSDVAELIDFERGKNLENPSRECSLDGYVQIRVKNRRRKRCITSESENNGQTTEEIDNTNHTGCETHMKAHDQQSLDHRHGEEVASSQFDFFQDTDLLVSCANPVTPAKQNQRGSDDDGRQAIRTPYEGHRLLGPANEHLGGGSRQEEGHKKTSENPIHSINVNPITPIKQPGSAEDIEIPNTSPTYTPLNLVDCPYSRTPVSSPLARQESRLRSAVDQSTIVPNTQWWDVTEDITVDVNDDASDSACSCSSLSARNRWSSPDVVPATPQGNHESGFDSTPADRENDPSVVTDSFDPAVPDGTQHYLKNLLTDSLIESLPLPPRRKLLYSRLFHQAEEDSSQEE